MFVMVLNFKAESHRLYISDCENIMKTKMKICQYFTRWPWKGVFVWIEGYEIHGS